METYSVCYNWGTQESGYLAKQILAAMQTEVLDDEGFANWIIEHNEKLREEIEEEDEVWGEA